MRRFSQNSYGAGEQRLTFRTDYDRNTIGREYDAASMLFCYIMFSTLIGPSAGRSNNQIYGATL